MAARRGGERRLRRRTGPGHRARHLPRRQHDLHRPGRVRPVHHRRTARCSCPRRSPRSPASLLGADAGAAGRGQARVTCSGWPRVSSRWLLLLVSQLWSTDQKPLAYALLLVATACRRRRLRAHRPGAQHLHRRRSTPTRRPLDPGRSTPCSALGTALAPVFVAIFVGLGFWWGLPLLAAALLVGVARRACSCRLRTRRRRRSPRPRQPRPPHPASRGASGSSPRSPCSTASARP